MPYSSQDHLIIFDADGTLIDAFDAIRLAFGAHGMDLGDLERFQKRHKIFKYLGGIKELPKNLTRQLTTNSRKRLLETLTGVYREQAALYPGVAGLINDLLAIKDVRVALVTRNVCNEPEKTLTQLFRRHDIDLSRLDMLHFIPLGEDKAKYFRLTRERLGINPARVLVCGDEHRDYEAALAAGVRPLIAAYGFEDPQRLIKKFGIPEEVICVDSPTLCAHVRHTLAV
jgi:phosphoglycolate phosphatase